MESYFVGLDVHSREPFLLFSRENFSQRGWSEETNVSFRCRMGGLSLWE